MCLHTSIACWNVKHLSRYEASLDHKIHSPPSHGIIFLRLSWQQICVTNWLQCYHSDHWLHVEVDVDLAWSVTVPCVSTCVWVGWFTDLTCRQVYRADTLAVGGILVWHVVRFTGRTCRQVNRADTLAVGGLHCICWLHAAHCFWVWTSDICLHNVRTRRRAFPFMWRCFSLHLSLRSFTILHPAVDMLCWYVSIHMFAFIYMKDVLSSDRYCLLFCFMKWHMFWVYICE